MLASVNSANEIIEYTLTNFVTSLPLFVNIGEIHGYNFYHVFRWKAKQKCPRQRERSLKTPRYWHQWWNCFKECIRAERLRQEESKYLAVDSISSFSVGLLKFGGSFRFEMNQNPRSLAHFCGHKSCISPIIFTKNRARNLPLWDEKLANFLIFFRAGNLRIWTSSKSWKTFLCHFPTE